MELLQPKREETDTPIRAPTVTFNNGIACPIFGILTWKPESGEITEVIEHAIDVGYRYFDCGFIYGTEKEVGEAISKKISDGVVKREELFISSKLWNTFHRPGVVEYALRESLSKLGVTYLDLFLMQWPFAFREGAESIPVDSNDKIIASDIDYIETWKAMEDLYKKGLAKSIGVCNFNKQQLERLMRHTKIKPVANQIECHPYLNQRPMMEFCRSKEILVIAYSPLASRDRPWATPEEPYLLEEAYLRQLCRKYEKTPLQVILRYQIQRGNITVLKTPNKNKLEECLNIFNFDLEDDDMDYISSFECNGRTNRFEAAIDHMYYPFHDEY